MFSSMKGLRKKSHFWSNNINDNNDDEDKIVGVESSSSSSSTTTTIDGEEVGGEFKERSTFSLDHGEGGEDETSTSTGTSSSTSSSMTTTTKKTDRRSSSSTSSSSHKVVKKHVTTGLYLDDLYHRLDSNQFECPHVAYKDRVTLPEILDVSPDIYALSDQTGLLTQLRQMVANLSPVDDEKVEKILAMIDKYQVDADAPLPGRGKRRLLHYACSRGNHYLVSQLIQRGAKVQRITDDGWTALHFNATWTDINKHKQQKNMEPSASMARPSSSTAKLEPDMEEEDDEDMGVEDDPITPIEVQASARSTAQAGASTKPSNASNSSRRHRNRSAAGRNKNNPGAGAGDGELRGAFDHIDHGAIVTRLLVLAGADPNATVTHENVHRTPLHQALQRRRHGIAEELLNAGACSTDFIDKDYNTLMDLMVHKNDLKGLVLLFMYSAPVDYVTLADNPNAGGQQWTPLHRAVNMLPPGPQLYDPGMVKILVQMGADKDRTARGGDGLTAAQMAKQRDQDLVTEFFFSIDRRRPQGAFDPEERMKQKWSGSNLVDMDEYSHHDTSSSSAEPESEPEEVVEEKEETIPEESSDSASDSYRDGDQFEDESVRTKRTSLMLHSN